MDNFLKQISKTAIFDAERRGYFFDAENIVEALNSELEEYREAEANQNTTDLGDIRVMEYVVDDEEFLALYDSCIHNTTMDELADIFIVCASSYAALPNLNTSRAEYFLIKAVSDYVLELVEAINHNDFRRLVMLKLKYNSLRQD